MLLKLVEGHTRRFEYVVEQLVNRFPLEVRVKSSSQFEVDFPTGFAFADLDVFVDGV